MERYIEISGGYETISEVFDVVQRESKYNCSITWDQWEIRPGTELLQKCILVRKNGIYAVVIKFSGKNTIKIIPVVTNHIVNGFLTSGRKITDVLIRSLIKSLIASNQKKIISENEEILKHKLA